MKHWLANLFSTPTGPEGSEIPSQTPGEPSFEALSAQKELQTLRLELDARDQTIQALKQEIERLRYRQDQLAEELARNQIEALFTDLSAPASQILTQADLLENQGKPVQARDVLSVARRMVRVLERRGVSFEGTPGQSVQFDPNRHTPLNAQSGQVYRPGQPVTVRFAGASHAGKLLYKAVVE